MSLLLGYDVETQNLPLFREPSSDPRQPHIVQLAAKLIDSETRQCYQAIDLIVKPDGWEIPEETVKIHGITTGTANRVGVPEEAVLMMLLTLEEIADVRIAHNESFDARIIRIAIKRFIDDEQADRWRASESYCTMHNCTNICRIPDTKGRKKFKWPRLEEAYKHFTGEEMTNAHNAMADVDACISVYWGILDWEAKDDT